MDELEKRHPLERQARQRTINRMLTMTHWYSPEELGKLLTRDPMIGNSLLKSWEIEHRIFSVDHLGQRLFAGFQFDDEIQPIPIVAEILAVFTNKDSWAIAAWFLFLNGWISNPAGTDVVAPVDAMNCPEKLLFAARQSRGSHFA